MKIDWQSEANKALDLVYNRMFEAHRGAFVWHAPTNTMLLFGNDGRPEQIENLKKLYPDLPIRATACNDYSFVMLAETNDDAVMTIRLWESWWTTNTLLHGPPDGFGRLAESLERMTATARIDRYFMGIERPWEQPA